MAATPEQVDAFRELRTRLLAMAKALDLSHFVTLVIPVTPASGASFVARNLALAFALEDSRVAVLIDCNLRHPGQHEAFGLAENQHGLFDYLEQRQPVVKLQPTAIPGLHLIPAGGAKARFCEHFSSGRMHVMMATLREASCYVFLDGPGTKGSPDARILSDLAEFVVLVAGDGKDTLEAISEAASVFDPAKFAGVVFNEQT
jgi:Mrp family chromosome partitioning ATPase